MRVLMLTYNVAGMGSFLRAFALARPLVRLGHDVTVIAGRSAAGLVRRDTVDAGVRVVQMADPAPLRFRHGGLSVVDLAGRVRYVLAHRCDVVHAFGHRPAVAIPARIARHRWGAVLVSDWADLWGLEGLARRRKVVWRWSLGAADHWGERAHVRAGDAVTVISDDLAARARSLRRDRDEVLVVGVGADEDAIRPMAPGAERARIGIPPDAPVVMHTGFAPYDVDLLADAFVAVARRVPEARLVMTGGSFPSVTARLRGEGLLGRTRHLGIVPTERYGAVLACADVMALPYRAGAVNTARSPHRFGEYMAAGRAVVTNATGDVARVVEREGVGVLAGESPEAFGGAVADLLLDPERRSEMGRRARRLAEGRLSWRNAAAELDLLYRRLRSRAQPPG